MYNLKNNRITERFKIRFPATIQAGTESPNRQLLHTKNISSSGAFLYTDKPLQESNRINLKIVLENKTLKKITGSESWLHVTGVVVRQEADGIAVKFDSHKIMSNLGL